MKGFPAVLLVAILAPHASREARSASADRGDPPLVALSVVDEETGGPVERFLVLPGVPYSGADDRSVASWQPHLARESAGGRYEWPWARAYETFRLRVEAEGYRPGVTDWLREADGPRDVTIRLRRDPGLRGVVLSPDGSPAAGATLGVALPNRSLRLDGRTIERAGERPAEKPDDRWRQPVTVRANAGGWFRLPTETDPAALLVVVHRSGYLERPFAELLGKDLKPTTARRLRLEPWGRIAGRVLWGDRPGAGESVELIVSRETRYPDMVGAYGTARSDAGGHFEFEAVPPGRVQLARLLPASDGKEAASYQFPVMHVDVRGGDATEVVLGGRGRVVAGRLTGLDSYEGLTLRVHPRAPHIGFPGDDELWRGWAALRDSPLGASVFRDAIPVGEDGTFRIEGLVPESYQLLVNGDGERVRGGTSFTAERAVGAEEGRQQLPEIRVTREMP